MEVNYYLDIIFNLGRISTIVTDSLKLFPINNEPILC